MTKKIKILLLILSLSLTLSYMSNTYSRYVADATGNVEVLFAKWQILVNDNDITNETTSSIEITPVVDENAHVAEGMIAPSSKGHFDIVINPENVGVSFEYDITLDVLNENMPDLMITKYAILDSNFDEKKDTITYKDIENNSINGSLDINDMTVATNSDEISTSSFEPFTIRICFEWYEGQNEQMNDEADTLIGLDALNNELEIEAKIKFEQKLKETV